MRRDNRQMSLAVFLPFAAAFGCLAALMPPAAEAASPTAAEEVELFQGMRDGRIEGKIVVRSDHDARVFLTNNTQRPLNIQLPEAFAAVPVFAQFGGGGGGGFGGGGGGIGGGGGGIQSGGGGFGGGGGGIGGGGGGAFSIPPEETERIDVAILCLDHGLRDPSSSIPFEMVPAEEHIDRPAVIELLKAFGRGQLQHGAAQAAVWHLNSDLSWQFLAAKLDGTRRSFNRSPYFNQAEIRAGMMYAQQAQVLAREAALEQPTQPAEQPDEAAERSEAKSTTEQEPESAPADEEKSDSSDESDATSGESTTEEA